MCSYFLCFFIISPDISRSPWVHLRVSISIIFISSSVYRVQSATKSVSPRPPLTCTEYSSSKIITAKPRCDMWIVFVALELWSGAPYGHLQSYYLIDSHCPGDKTTMDDWIEIWKRATQICIYLIRQHQRRGKIMHHNIDVNFRCRRQWNGSFT